jgi:hypothetical protein
MNTRIPSKETAGLHEPQTTTSPSNSNPIDPMAVLRLHSGSVMTVLVGDGLSRTLTVKGTLEYRDELLKACGDLPDPLAVMMVDQSCWVHHQIGRLLVAATKTKDPAEAERLHATAARLMAEFRRTSLALRQYRAPVSDRPLMALVKQQNLGDGHLSVAGSADASPPPVKKSRRNEVGSNGHANHNRVAGHFGASADCREEELAAAAGTNGHGALATP